MMSEESMRARLHEQALSEWLRVAPVSAEWIAEMRAPQPMPAQLPAEARQIIERVRDNTSSKAEYDACVSLVGEATP
jgi:hypothetical protein